VSSLQLQSETDHLPSGDLIPCMVTSAKKKPGTALKFFSETPGSGFSIAGRYVVRLSK
jgi:hypothetical protein